MLKTMSITSWADPFEAELGRLPEKLDDLAVYADRLRAIFAASGPRSITVLRMEVPCCSGLARAAVEAHHAVVPQVPLRVETIGIQTGAVVSRS